MDIIALVAFSEYMTFNYIIIIIVLLVKYLLTTSCNIFLFFSGLNIVIVIDGSPSQDRTPQAIFSEPSE